MLNKVELKQWTDALRSGEYKQGEGYLKRKTDDGIVYCCLGVLCELQGVEIKKYDGYWRSFEFKSDDGYWMSASLPVQLSKKSELGGGGERLSRLGMPPINGCHGALSTANDKGVTFKEIADYLDTYYPAID